MKDNGLPRLLKAWFILHFFLDIIFAIPLIFATSWFLSLLQFSTENLMLARLVGAALFAIGVISLLMHNGNLQQYRVMLTFKILWATAAIVAITISLYEGTSPLSWLFLSIFMFFLGIWSYYRYKLK